jgi:hypothetical protein
MAASFSFADSIFEAVCFKLASEFNLLVFLAA